MRRSGSKTETEQPSTSSSRRNVRPTVRRPHFEFSSSLPRFYYKKSPVLTNIFNTFHALATPIEGFFIRDGQRIARSGKVTNPVLSEELEAFIKQEASHSAEHNRANRWLEEQGYPVKWAHARAKLALEQMRPKADDMLLNGMIAAGEHLLSEFGELFLSNSELANGLHPEMRALFLWHAYEEIEHKAVSMDLYYELFGNNLYSYAARLRGLWMIARAIVPVSLEIVQAFWKVDDVRLTLGNAREVLDYLFVSPAFASRIIRNFLPFLMPNFHPWNVHESAEHLERYRGLAVKDEWVAQN